nr:restriction endonuclease subunit S [Clostridium perfringens]
MTELGEIPKEWNIKRIGDITEIKTGGTPATKCEEYWKNGTIPWMASGDINKKIINKVNGKITNIGMMNSAAKLLPKDTVMIALNGQGKTKGTVGYLNIELTCNQSLAGFLPNYKEFNSKYLYYNLQNRYFELRELAGDGARNGLNLGLLRNIKIPLPFLSEQEKIASILSMVDEQIENTEKLIRKNKELKKGLMQQLLTKGIGHTEFKKTELGNIPKEWEIVKFDSVIELLTDYEANGSFSSIKENVNIYNEKNYAYFVRATDLEKKDYINSVKYVDEKSYEFLSKTELKGGELLISKRGQIGKVYLMPNLNIKCTLAPNLYLIKLLNDKVDNSYMYHYFTSSRGQKLLVRNSASTTLGAIYKEDLKKINILLPTIDEQRRISRILSNVEGKILNNQNKKEKLEELKKGLMQRLLTGYIRVI